MLGQKSSIASGKYIRLITSCREEINHILFDKLFTCNYSDIYIYLGLCTHWTYISMF